MWQRFRIRHASEGWARALFGVAITVVCAAVFYIALTDQVPSDAVLYGLLAALLFILFAGRIGGAVRRTPIQDAPDDQATPLGQRLGRGPFASRTELDRFLDGSIHLQAEMEAKARFTDIAGQDAAKREVAEIVDMLRAPERYRVVGAEIPRGILLMGPPGTGKTLMARALAGEAGVPFFHLSASAFIEVFVGVGAARVRKVFERAKAKAPAIVFIDELDAIGRLRGSGLGGGNDEREQTLNQILSEMDGFARTGPNAPVIVVAATNRPDVLDPALLRPGRFDRHIAIDLPDLRAREQILRLLARAIPLAEGCDLSSVARATPGLSGADLRNLMNEAAMATARAGRFAVTDDDIDAVRDRVLLGLERALILSADERHRLAVHEAGHAVVAHALPHADPIHKISIIPRGRALGGTHQVPESERHTLSAEYLKDRLAVAMGGRAAESVFLGDVSSGAEDDIATATRLARAMVTRWGMDPDLGPIDLRQSADHPFLGREIAQPQRMSDAMAARVDAAVSALLSAAESRAIAVLRERRTGFEKLVVALEAAEQLDQAAITTCLGPRKPPGAELVRLSGAMSRPAEP